MHCAMILRKSSGCVFSVAREASIGDAAALMSERRIGALMILDGAGRLAGILSERDVTRAIARHRAEAAAMAVGQFMTADIVTCSPDDHLTRVMERMNERQIRHLPVVQGDRPLGMISMRDVIEALLEETAEERDQLRDYVAAATC